MFVCACVRASVPVCVSKRIPSTSYSKSIRVLEVYPSQEKCISICDNAYDAGSPPQSRIDRDPFLLCVSSAMQKQLGGYEAALRLYSRITTSNKCNEATFVLCVLLQQLRPEIIPVFDGHVVYDVRIESNRFIQSHDKWD